MMTDDFTFVSSPPRVTVNTHDTKIPSESLHLSFKYDFQ